MCIIFYIKKQTKHICPLPYFHNLPNSSFSLLYKYYKKGKKMEKTVSIVVFTTPTCGWCRKVKSYLKQNNLIYKEVDVSTDAYAMRVMVNKSGQMGVPQLWINNVAVVGFDKAKIDRLTK